MRLQDVGCSVAVALGLTCAAGVAAAEPARAVKVTVLSTMLAGNRGGGIGEWGFAALLEVDGQRLLIDTGERPETVVKNASELGIDLSGVSDLVLTHNHSDHTAGLLSLRRELSKKNPRALSRVHVAKGIFFSRPGAGGTEGNGLLPIRPRTKHREVSSSNTRPRHSCFHRCGSQDRSRAAIPSAIGV